MDEGVSISYLGDGKYRVTFPKPIKLDIKTFLSTGSHNVRLLAADKKREMIIGIEGKKATLLDLFRSMGIEEAAIKSYDEAMTL